MEEDLLEEMIRDRETTISMIQKKMVEQERKFERVRSNLKETRKTLEKNKLVHQMDIHEMVLRHETLLKDYKEAKGGLDMKKQQQGAHLHVYNEVMKAVATPESRDSSYVMRMQAQLCKAMHSMGMMETQLALSSSQAESIQKKLKEMLTGTVEEKAQVELQIMNDLVIVDTGRREAESKTKELKDNFIKKKGDLLDRIEREKEAPPEDDDDDEKAELQEILQDGREEIERLEEENKAELEKLEEIKKNVMEAKGQEFVDEIVHNIEEEFKARREEEENSEEEDSD